MILFLLTLHIAKSATKTEIFFTKNDENKNNNENAYPKALFTIVKQ